MIFRDLTATVGGTPIVELARLGKGGTTIIEATGGNTGIGLAFACAIRLSWCSSRTPLSAT